MPVITDLDLVPPVLHSTLGSSLSPVWSVWSHDPASFHVKWTHPSLLGMSFSMFSLDDLF